MENHCYEGAENEPYLTKKAGYHQLCAMPPDSPVTFVGFKKLDGSDASIRIPYWHEQLEIKYFLRGGAEINCGPNCFLASDGDLVIINPCEYHSMGNYLGTEPPIYHLMMIDLGHPAVHSIIASCPELFLNQKIRGITEFYIPFLKNRLSDPSLSCIRLFGLLSEEYCRSDVENTFYKENLLRAFLYSLIRDAANVGEYPEGMKNRGSALMLMPAMRYIDQHYSEQLTVEKLAECCTMSVSYFSHIFSEATGSSVIRYVNALRVNKSKLLLTNTSLGVSEIGERTGFRDSAYFSRVFKNFCGCSPASYRNQKSQDI